ncbi:hypothetical protein D3C78_1089410 [compost metagenome]
MLAVHAVDGVALAEQRPADFQGGEVQGHQDHPLPFALRGLQVLQPLDVRQTRQARARPPPAHRHLEEGDAAGGEVLAQQVRTLAGGEFGEAQLEVACSDLPARPGTQQHQRAERSPELQQRLIGQLHDQPEQPQPQPQQPEARVKKGGTKAGTFHQHIQSGEQADYSTPSRTGESAMHATCDPVGLSL